MATSVWAQVVDALVDTMRAQPGHRAPGADGDEDLVLVLDGPEPAMTGDGGSLLLIIGGSVESEDEPGVAGQSRATLTGNRSRDEMAAITCNAVAQGSIDLPDAALAVAPPTVRSLRAAAFGILATVETVLRANPTLGFTSLAHMSVEIGSRMVVQQYLTEDNQAVCSVVFSVDYQARI